jgi:CO dehydrogenase nickel-insertion accessory protein CooC1
VLVVVEPTAKSLLSGRRLARMATIDSDVPKRVVAVASKVGQPGDVEMIARGTGLEVIAEVPWDEDLAEAERRMRAPLDEAPDSAAVRAVESLVERLSEERVR